MCGITGVFAHNDNGIPFLKKVDKAVSSLHKRGPDNFGTYSHNKIALGHTRLSIIDTSEAASQPFTDSSGRYTIIFNGEFYNFQEHRHVLLSKGFQLRSHSDTEVLLYLYITEGSSCLEKINGFFAFAIYDKEEESLFLARDRYGVKPLLIYKDDDKIIFASEMKALLEYDIPKKIDQTSLFQYLQLNYIPSPYSIFRNVTKIRPGTFLEISKNKINEKEYYKIPLKSEEEIKRTNISYEEAQKKIVELLDDSVKLRLISDVPLGAFLSGGIDSSAIVALASRHVSQLNTYSIGFKDEPLFDETHYAQVVADKFKTNHTVFPLTNDDIFSVLNNVLDYTDEPFGDSSALAVYILSMQTRKHVTVALSGDGADELFGGYNKHKAEYRLKNAGISEKTIQLLSPLWRIIPRSRNSFLSNKIRQFDRFAIGSNLSHDERYWQWCGFAHENDVEELMNYKADNEYCNRKKQLLQGLMRENDLNEVLLADVNLVLQSDMLVKVDLMSMANSLEIRTPFLDYRIVDFIFSLPSSFKVDKTIGKKVLQDAFKNILPEMIYHRPKRGFEVPLLKWFRKELKSFIFDDLLKEEFILDQGLFDQDAIKELKKMLLSNNPGDSAARIWGLVVFQSWYKKFYL